MRCSQTLAPAGVQGKMGDMSSPKHDLALRMAELARSIAPPISVDAVLHDVSKTAKELIPGVDEAGILLVGRNNTHETLGPTSSLLNQLDELQMKHHEGPCLEAALNEV